MTRHTALMAALALFVSSGVAQDHLMVPWRARAPALVLTGNVSIDMIGRTDMLKGSVVQQTDFPLVGESLRKSPWLAGGLSLALPGAGEFYSESYVKSAAFFAVEVAVWVVAYTYNKQGNNQTNSFQNYADVHWDVYQYAQYAENNLHPPNVPYNWRKYLQENGSLPPWVQVNWDELNRMERDIGQNGGVGSYYSHVLPPHGDQQYFEEIGKYEQFNMGWDDANPAWLPDYSVMVANHTANSSYYGGQRGQANSFYNTATTAVSIAIVNHIVSAIDAALTAGAYNRRLHAEAGFQRVPLDDRMVDLPVLKLRYDL